MHRVTAWCEGPAWFSGIIVIYYAFLLLPAFILSSRTRPQSELMMSHVNTHTILLHIIHAYLYVLTYIHTEDWRNVWGVSIRRWKAIYPSCRYVNCLSNQICHCYGLIARGRQCMSQLVSKCIAASTVCILRAARLSIWISANCIPSMVIGLRSCMQQAMFWHPSWEFVTHHSVCLGGEAV